MTRQPSVSVFMTAASAAASLPDTLRAIERQDYPGKIEVVVAAADTATAESAKGHEVTVVDNPTGLTPVGLNLAVAASTGEVLVRVDAHSIVPPDYVRRLVEVLESSGADNVGGSQVPRGHTFLEKAIAGAMSSRFGAGDARHRVGGPSGETDTVYLGAFPRHVLERHGGYDERYVRHQDYELNHRIRSSGGTVWFDPGIEVAYRPRPSLVALGRQYFQYGRWKRFFARSHPRALRPRQWAPPLLVSGLAIALIGSIWWAWLLVVPLAYAFALIVSSLLSLPRVGLAAVLMPGALAVMHLAWGLGFLSPQSRDL